MTGRERLANIRKVMGGTTIEEFLENALAEVYDEALSLVKDWEDGGEDYSDEGHAACINLLKEITEGLEENGLEEIDDGRH